MRSEADDAIDGLLAFLAARRGVDLRDQQRETVERRVASRVTATGSSDLNGYVALVKADATELDRLLSALLIRVTSFFRDDEVFAALRDRVLRSLLADTGPDRPLRAWSIGCATGEETWSIAALLAEACLPHGAEFEVLGTDADIGAIEIARRGVYSAHLAGGATEHLPRPCFEVDSAGIRVADSLRGRVRFARHNLMGASLAPPEAIVASFDLVLCRNVLIYFDRRLQDHAFRRLASAVRPGGALVLGIAETPPDDRDVPFAPFPDTHPRLKILRRRETS